MTQALLGTAAAAAILPVVAGSSSGNVVVDISLAMPGAQGQAGTCVSQTLSEETGAVVRVTCQDGVFVSITPAPGARFVGTHGGAYSYYFGPAFSNATRSGSADFTEQSGSIASFRVYGVGPSSADGPLDMLVSF
jgi:hypothetical protein